MPSNAPPVRNRVLPQCFVAMPISTPESSVASYRDDPEHFFHVLTHLLQPALELVGIEMLSPVATGADLVHAAIVERIVKSDLMLCDMSALNPNVFFEMGLRTALNKPLCFVVDNLTAPAVPFDTGIVNYHVYRSDLTPWTLAREIEALAAHIRRSVEQSKDGNALWRYFGLRAQFGAESQKHSASGDKLEYLAMEVEGLRRKFDGMFSGVAAAASAERRGRSVASSNISATDDDMAGALLTFDPANSPSEDLTLLSVQMRARLKRSRTRTEEAAIERILAQIDETLKSRAAAT